MPQATGGAAGPMEAQGQVTTEARVLLSASAHRLPGWRSHRRILRPHVCERKGLAKRRGKDGARSCPTKSRCTAAFMLTSLIVCVNLSLGLSPSAEHGAHRVWARMRCSGLASGLAAIDRRATLRLAGQQCGQQRTVKPRTAQQQGWHGPPPQ